MINILYTDFLIKCTFYHRLCLLIYLIKYHDFINLVVNIQVQILQSFKFFNKGHSNSLELNTLIFFTTAYSYSMHLTSPHGFRNQSAFSKRISDHFIKKQFNRFNLKLSSSKTTLQLCPTERSQSQVNQTINNLGISQDLQSPRLSQFHIKTFIRFRPLKLVQQLHHKETANNLKIAIIDKKKILCEDNFFIYDHVFQRNSQQQEIYNYVCKEMVQHFVRGFNSTVFTYGQTGSGKTYTMFGDINEEKKKGIIPTAIKDIFDSIDQISHQNQNGSCNQVIVSCSMLEIYKEVMIDLLSNQKSDLKIKQNQFFNVSNLTIKQVVNQKQMNQVLKIGNQSKKMRQTHMNQSSSRSHVIFTVYLEVRKQHQKRLSKFNLVDLAGSQKVSKSKVDGQGLEQAKKINLSLSCLGNTINALLKRNDHIPYRQSKLTRLLYESLGGNSLTRLIVTCSSQQTQIQQTLSSLKFASRAKNLKTNPLINTLRKSQKSVSRIAYENLKTNLNKAQYKIKNIKKYMSQLKNTLLDCQDNQNRKQLSLNKQNISINSNTDLSQSKSNKKQNSNTLFYYKKFVQNVQNTLSSINIHQNELNLTKNHKKSTLDNKLYAQTLLNPFLLISDSKQKQLKDTCIHSQQSQKKQSDKKIKKVISIKNSISKDDNQSYWSIIKKQEKQIQNLKNKLEMFENQSGFKSKQALSRNQSKQQLRLNLIQPISQFETRKNSHILCIQNTQVEGIQLKQKSINQKNNNKRKLNIKIANKVLPVRQINLTSPTHYSISSSKNKKLLNSTQKITSSINNSIEKRNQNIKKQKKTQKFKSPRQFVPTQYKDQIQIPKNQQNFNLLKQICKKLQHKNQYHKFQKNILLRQLQLMYGQKAKKTIKSSTQHSELQEKQKECKNQQQNSNQLNKKLTLSETNQLLISQSRYIQQLQTLIVNQLKKDIISGKEQEKIDKISSIKLR